MLGDPRDQRPTYDPDLERQLLGMLMLLSEANQGDEIKRALGIVRAKDFFRGEHRLVFAAILTLDKQGHHFGVEAVHSLLERKGKLNGALSHFDLEQMQSEGARVMPLVPAEQASQLRTLGEYRDAIQAVASLRQFVETTTDPELIRAHFKELSATLDRSAYLSTATTQTFRELVATDFPPTIPVLDPLIMAGDSMLIVGNSKTGKSVFALQLALAIASGGLAFDVLPVHQLRDVLFLNLDDRPSRIKARAQYMMASYPENVYPERLHFAHRWPPLDQGGEGMLHTWAERHPEGVIIIDLLEKIRPARGGSVYQADYAAVGALTDVAHVNGVTVLTVHHSNKSGLAPGSTFNADFSVSGSEAIRGAADGHIVFHPMTQEQPGARQLTVKTRDMGESGYALAWDEFLHGWRWEGESLQHKIAKRMSPERQSLLDTIQEAARPLAPGEIAQRLHKQTNQVYYLLFQMKNAGQIVALDDGRYQHPSEHARTKPPDSDSH